MMNPILKKTILTGIIFYTFLFVVALVFSGDFSYMGVKNQAVENMVMDKYLTSIIFRQVEFLLIYLIVGMVSGLFTGYMLLEWNNRFHIFKNSGVANVVIQLFLYVSALLSVACYYPQLFVEKVSGTPFLSWLDFVTQYGSPYLFLYVVGILFLSTLILSIIRFPKTIGLFLFSLIGLYLIVKPNNKPEKIIILLGMDSARWDKLTDSTLAPTFSHVINQSTVFPNVWVDIPRTFPSWTTIMTGQSVLEHGIRHMFPTKLDRYQNFETLPKLLGKYGYETTVISDFAGDIFSRIDFGFDHIKVPYFNFETLINNRAATIHWPIFPFILNRAGRTIFSELSEMANNPDPYMLKDEILQQIDSGSEKQFITTFWSSAHFPYAPPYPWYKTYQDPNYKGANKYQKMDVLGSSDSSAADQRALISLYDGGISAMDDAFRCLISDLKNRDLLDKTIFIVLADHGEYLFEPNMATGHGEHLRGDKVLNIPFFIWDPEKPNYQKNEKLGSSSDIFPTVATYLGFTNNKDSESISLLDTTSFRIGVYSETGLWFTDQGNWFYQHQRIMYPDVVSLCEIDPNYNDEIVLKDQYKILTLVAKHRSWTTNQYKLIYIPMTDTVKYELYDRIYDPNEQHNLAETNPERVRQLKEQLFDFVLKHEKDAFLFNDRLWVKRRSLW